MKAGQRIENGLHEGSDASRPTQEEPWRDDKRKGNRARQEKEVDWLRRRCPLSRNDFSDFLFPLEAFTAEKEDGTVLYSYGVDMRWLALDDNRLLALVRSITHDDLFPNGKACHGRLASSALPVLPQDDPPRLLER